MDPSLTSSVPDVWGDRKTGDLTHYPRAPGPSCRLFRRSPRLLSPPVLPDCPPAPCVLSSRVYTPTSYVYAHTHTNITHTEYSCPVSLINTHTYIRIRPHMRTVCTPYTSTYTHTHTHTDTPLTHHPHTSHTLTHLHI